MIPEATWAAANRVDPSSASDLALAHKDGGTFRLSDQKGKRVLLAFWASWCAPCRRELPALADWAKKHPQIVTIAINVDKAEADANRFLGQVGFDLPVAFAPDAAELGRFGVASMPTMFLVDGKGSIAWRHSGYSEDKGFEELDVAVGAKP